MTSKKLMVQILTWIRGAGTRNPAAPATLRCMPLPPLRQSDWPPARVTIESPREAALRAIVYRNQLREKPRERGLRIAGLVGTLLVHLIFLFGAILGPAYQPDALPSEPLGVLHVRLIDNKPEPPPPPPVRGTPPKRHGPVHHGHVAQATPAHRVTPARRQSAMTAPSAQPLPAVPAPPIDRPVIAVKPVPSAPAPKIVAAPLPPVSVPKPAPAPAPQLQPIAVSPPPPAVTLQAPQAIKPVPPRFQPEPVRKAQAEGTRAMPPPPSLAMPALPAQSAPTIQAPAIAMDKVVPTIATPPAVTAVTRADVSAAPPAPEMEAVPLSAPAAPTVNLQSTLKEPSPVVAREQPQIQSPTIHVAPAQLAAVPLPPAEAAPATPRVQAPSVTFLPSVVPPAQLAIQPPVAKVDITPAKLPTPAAELAPASKAATEAPSKSAPTPATTPEMAAAPTAQKTSESSSPAPAGQDVSSAPDATPQGSDTATPGQPQGTTRTVPPSATTRAGDLASTTAGQGHVTGSQGHGMQGSPDGTYIQLLPHGDTKIMHHRTTGIHYQPTRFDKYWTPEGESSIDTALRHAVEKTTVSHTFHLPRGVRVKCVAMPLLPVLMLGCGNPDPPAAPLNSKIYKKLNQPTLNSSIPKIAPPASTVAPPAPVQLNNRVQCAEARVAGGPLPPGCDTELTPKRPVSLPASSGSSWVPASDQFH
ncbi:hypothetical protein SAMN05192579_105171 [Rhodanobacter glycinis]|uniref:Uncharacterized protein n=2 Tax=Rhodanobacter glycinis TaxID=582702 RepID=A0A1I4BMC1_9GAMM|nr:hypothetical protein SAMN05192579_105171 [Rhodanobacter glycinis]